MLYESVGHFYRIPRRLTLRLATGGKAIVPNTLCARALMLAKRVEFLRSTTRFLPLSRSLFLFQTFTVRSAGTQTAALGPTKYAGLAFKDNVLQRRAHCPPLAATMPRLVYERSPGPRVVADESPELRVSLGTLPIPDGCHFESLEVNECVPV